MDRRLATLAFVLAAGCAAPAAAPPPVAGAPDDWAERILAFDASHDHASLAHHAGLSTPNFEIVGYDPLYSEHYGGATAGGYLCGDAARTTGGRTVAVVESRSELGFALADVTDPARPRWLGEMVMKATRVYDVAVVPDGKHVVLVTSDAQPGGLLPAGAHVAMEWRSACGDVRALASPSDPLPRPASIVLVSIEDPRAPAIVDHRPLPGIGHSVSSTILDGRTWILASAVATSGADTFSFYELAATPVGGRLSPLGVYAPPATPDQLAPDVGGHDEGVIAKHPVTGQTLAWLVNRRDFTILDVEDPRAPRVVGTWSDWRPERDGFSAHLHSVVPFPDVRSGRHYTLIGPEYGARPPSVPTGIVWVLDTTDPAAPREVAAWTLSYESEWSEGFLFSTHYLSVVGDTLFASMYHAGVWAVDLAPLGTAPFVQLDSVGAFLPDRASPRPPAQPIRWTPTVEEALPLPDGTLLTFDSNSGLYTFRFDASRPAPAPPRWPIEPLT